MPGTIRQTINKKKRNCHNLHLYNMMNDKNDDDASKHDFQKCKNKKTGSSLITLLLIF